MKFAKTTFALLVLAVALASAVRTNQKSEKTHKKDLIKEKVLGSDAAA